MRMIFFFAVTGALLLAPFVVLRRPWAVRLWGRIKSLFVLYVVVIVVSAAVWLVVRWDDFYG
jgi:hypothetical protein